MLKKSVICFLFSILILSYAGPSCAVPRAPKEFNAENADGSQFKVRQWGDEFFHGWEHADGYSLSYDSSGNWTYATRDSNGSLMPSNRIAGKHQPPAGTPKHLRPAGAARAFALAAKAAQAPSRAAAAAKLPVNAIGTANILFILVNFSDTAAAYAPADFNTMLFGTGNKSLKDFYEEVSYGKFSVSPGPGGVLGWYSAPKPHNYYGSNGVYGIDQHPAELVIEAIKAADAAGFDFTPYDQNGDGYVDAVAIVHQGRGEEESGNSRDIWSHSFNLKDAALYLADGTGTYTTHDGMKVDNYIMMPEKFYTGIETIGVFAHEYGHALGLPDLYDTDYSSDGIGEWSLMSGGSWTMVSNPGDTPSHMDAWCKYYLGWVTPTLVTGTLAAQNIIQASQSGDVYQLLTGSPASGGEYFLIENREKTGFDAGLPGQGLLIWHIDESKTNNDGECYTEGSCSSTHYHVSLIQADGKYDLEHGANSGDSGDPYYSGLASAFSDFTYPSSHWYSGPASHVSITDISASSTTMIATLSIEAPSIAVSILPPSKTSVKVWEPLGPFYLNMRNTGMASATFYLQPYLIKDGITSYSTAQVATIPAALLKKIAFFYKSPKAVGNYTLGFRVLDASGTELSNGFFDFTVRP